MPLWNGSTINKTDVASMFNQLSSGTRAVVRKANGLLYVVMGKPGWEPRPNVEGVSFEGVKRISGNKIEKRLLGRLETPRTVADGAAELTTTTPLYSPDTYGAATWDLTHYAETFGVPDSEYDRIKGKESKTKNFISDKALEISLAYERELGNQINGTQVGFTRTQMGSWVHAVSDGTTTGEATYANYGGIDRTDAANADFKGFVLNVNGPASLLTLLTARNSTRVNGGNIRLGVTGVTLYTAIETKVQNMQQYVMYDEKWSKFGGLYFRYANVTFVQEHRAPAQTIGMLDPDTWKFWMDSQGMVDAESVLMLDPSRTAARVIPTRAWTQLICDHPGANAKITGVSSFS